MILEYSRGFDGKMYADSNNYFELSQIVRALWTYKNSHVVDAASTRSLDEHVKRVEQFRSMASDIEDLQRISSSKQKSKDKYRAALTLHVDPTLYADEIEEASKQYEWRAGFLLKKILDFPNVTEVDSKPTGRLY